MSYENWSNIVAGSFCLHSYTYRPSQVNSQGVLQNFIEIPISLIISSIPSLKKGLEVPYQKKSEDVSKVLKKKVKKSHPLEDRISCWTQTYHVLNLLFIYACNILLAISIKNFICMHAETCKINKNFNTKKLYNLIKFKIMS